MPFSGWLATYLVLGSLGVAAFATLDGAASDGAYLLVSLLPVAAIAIGIRHFRPDRRRPWLLLLGSQAAFLVSDGWWVLAELGGTAPGAASAPALSYFAGYILLALAALDLVRARQPRHTLTAALDSLLVGLAGAVVLWLTVGTGIAADPSLATVEKVVLLGYLVSDVLLVSGAAYLLLAARERPISLALLAGGLVALTVADVSYALDGEGAAAALAWPDIFWMASYLLVGLAALVPSMLHLAEPVRHHPSPQSRRQLTLLALTIAIFIGGVTWQAVQGVRVELEFFLPLGALIGVLLVLRINELITIHRRIEQRYADLLANASDAVAIVRPDGQLTFQSGSAELLGAADHGPVDGSLYDRVHADDLPAAQSAIEQVAVVPGTQRAAEWRVLRHDGQWRWVRALLTNAIDNRNIGGIVANYRDVTERREADARLRFQARLLEEVQHAVVVTDPAGVVRYWNKAAESIYGWSAEEAVGQPLIELTAGVSDGQPVAITHVIPASRWSGELELRRKDGSRLTAMVTDSTILDADGAVEGIVGISFDISDRKALEEQLRRQAFSDSLTGLANRALFMDRVGNALSRGRRRGGAPLAVMFIDIDDFKTVNDSLGHASGDELLVAVAERIRSAVRPGDTVARLGGDEFAVLLEDAGLAGAEDVARRLLESLSQPFELAQRTLNAGASVGIALTGGGERLAVEDLLRNADTAMYEAKNSGRGRYSVYHPTMHRAALRRLQLKADLPRAISGGELGLEFQPIYRLADGQPVGAEALLRWTHPTLGAVPAPELIGLAEETGEVVPLGRWVARAAMEEASRWQLARGEAGDALMIHINASALELRDAGYVRTLAELLRETGIAPASVVIELTETGLLADADGSSSSVLTGLRQLGVRLAIDDFGTGYSSLDYLGRLPVDVLKIDRSLVARANAAEGGWAIARSVVELARSLGLETVAEGLEHGDELNRLTELGCTYGQGFLLSPPLVAAQMAALLAPPRLLGPAAAPHARTAGHSGARPRSAGLDPAAAATQ